MAEDPKKTKCETRLGNFANTESYVFLFTFLPLHTLGEFFFSAAFCLHMCVYRPECYEIEKQRILMQRIAHYVLASPTSLGSRLLLLLVRLAN